ncbi:hypothetical protein [Micromonospora sp. KC721]|uniref:hypothetical protein n=1 Tax=Micromonospora sp. KC721 TaxID=2530380 RepID=UPI0010F14436|nr:hypothetical protein [Micromonospora sp. KC721]TDB79070.1 hypothetical protein E1182_14060 [Micromonospora sp. KC721]
MSVLAMAACGGEQPSKTATPTLPATTSVADAPAAAATASAVAADPASEKKLCEAAKKIGDESRTALVKAASSGEDVTPVVKKAYTEMAKGLADTAATAGPGSEVAPALVAFGTEAGKAAKDMAAADSPALEKAGKDLTAACKKAGVAINF